jgi:hypothetical protein
MPGPFEEYLNGERPASRPGFLNRARCKEKSLGVPQIPFLKFSAALAKPKTTNR